MSLLLFVFGSARRRQAGNAASGLWRPSDWRGRTDSNGSAGCFLLRFFLIALFGLSSITRRSLFLSPVVAIQTVTLVWLLLVYASACFLIRVDERWEETAFAGDFALLTSCTALVFVPAGFFLT